MGNNKAVGGVGGSTIEETVGTLSRLVEELPHEDEDQSDVSQTDLLLPQKVVYGRGDSAVVALRHAKSVITRAPKRIHDLKNLLEKIGPRSNDPKILDLYGIIINEVTQLGMDFQGAREAITKQGKSLETLRRYERATRRTLRQLLDFLKLQMDVEEGQIPINIVGDIEWTLEKTLLLGPASVYTHKYANRGNLWRELYMLKEEVSLVKKTQQILSTAVRRYLTGEPIIQDMYTPQRDGAVIGISSDEIGGNIVRVDLLKDTETKEIIARKGVYFGSEEGIMLRVYSQKGMSKKIYGPGLFLQKFKIAPGYTDKTVFFLQIDGEVKLRQLEEGETLITDPLHVYAWESSVTFELSKFGSIIGRLVRGDIPYWVEFKGPGKLWYSNVSFSDGYMGWYFTPAHWVYTIREFLTSLPKRILGSK